MAVTPGGNRRTVAACTPPPFTSTAASSRCGALPALRTRWWFGADSPVSPEACPNPFRESVEDPGVREAR